MLFLLPSAAAATATAADWEAATKAIWCCDTADIAIVLRVLIRVAGEMLSDFIRFTLRL